MAAGALFCQYVLPNEMCYHQSIGELGLELAKVLRSQLHLYSAVLALEKLMAEYIITLLSGEKNVLICFYSFKSITLIKDGATPRCSDGALELMLQK